jgi:hypothetical protein
MRGRKGVLAPATLKRFTVMYARTIGTCQSGSNIVESSLWTKASRSLWAFPSADYLW